ncbi:AraC family transcriptional regulator [Granulicella aggregans]|uniref:AraC family transcriptional regulator n=1 Tax=Granulicella aggregans TaxID=474949 RepID=UPI0037BED0D2
MHEVRQYRNPLLGVEAVSLRSVRQFPRHSHDQFGIGVINSGGHRSWSCLGWVEAVRGDIIMVNPGEMHDGSSLDGKPRGWNMLYFEPQIASQILAEDQSTAVHTLLPNARDRYQAVRVRRLFDAVADPQPDGLHIDEELVIAVSYAFRHHGGHRPSPFPGLPCVRRIVTLIDREPERPFSLQAMADIAGVSRFHLLRGFSRVTGVNPHAYILQRRVRLARRLVAAGWELGEASIEAGFADQSHMTRAFVRQLGITPARYRQAVAGTKSRTISFKTACPKPSTIST